MLKIRHAVLEDMPIITEIYNDAILNTRTTLDTVPKTIEERQQWYKDHMPCYPILVAEYDNTVVGWASISKWSERPGYAKTVIASEYLDSNFRGRGIGRELLMRMLEVAYEVGYHTVLGLIYAGNEVSLRMVESIGFKVVGIMKEVGYKFDDFQDVCLVQHMRPQDE